MSFPAPPWRLALPKVRFKGASGVTGTSGNCPDALNMPSVRVARRLVAAPA
jgi:hypothetical protein